VAVVFAAGSCKGDRELDVDAAIDEVAPAAVPIAAVVDPTDGDPFVTLPVPEDVGTLNGSDVAAAPLLFAWPFISALVWA
jgi:hypothetical protein